MARNNAMLALLALALAACVQATLPIATPTPTVSGAAVGVGLKDKISGKIPGLAGLGKISGLAGLGNIPGLASLAKISGLPGLTAGNGTDLITAAQSYISGIKSKYDWMFDLPIVGDTLESTAEGLVNVQSGSLEMMKGVVNTAAPIVTDVVEPINNMVDGLAEKAGKSKLLRYILLSSAATAAIKKQIAAFDYAKAKLELLVKKPMFKDATIYKEMLSLLDGLTVARDAMIEGVKDAVDSSVLLKPAAAYFELMGDLQERITSLPADMIEYTPKVMGAVSKAVVGSIKDASSKAKAIKEAVPEAIVKTLEEKSEDSSESEPIPEPTPKDAAEP